jgi:DNA mismatch repair ATPase MutL
VIEEEEEQDEDEEEEEEDDDDSPQMKKTAKKVVKKSKKKKRSDDDEEESPRKKKKKRKAKGSDDEEDEDEDYDEEDGGGSDDEDDEDEEEDDDEDEEEEEEEESEEEDEYTQKEHAYVVQDKPEEKTLKQAQKIMDQYETVWLNAKVLFVNFLAEDPQYLLKKLINIAELVSENLKMLIISLPQDVGIDTYSLYARRLCEMFTMNGGELNILFIKGDDKQEFINRVFKREKKKLTQLSEVKLSLSLNEGTLLYSWGNATKGKLGLSSDLSVLKAHPQFFSECKSIQAQYDPDQQEEEEV